MALRAGIAAFAILATSSGFAAAQSASLVKDSSFFRNSAAPVQVSAPANEAMPSTGASLFAGRAATSLFAPRAKRVRPAPPPAIDAPVTTGPAAERIRHLIARAEAGRDGYDAVQHGAKRRPSRPPTQMTIAEIYDWIAATPGQPHAIGRYQFIPSTLRRLVRDSGTDPSRLFTPQVQDALADMLLAEAGFHEAKAGQLPRHGFMDRLAKIWAGLPNSSGKSHYHGYAGNRATMTWAKFDAEMAQIFPG